MQVPDRRVGLGRKNSERNDLTRIATHRSQKASLHHALLQVELQESFRRSPLGGERLDQCPLKREVVFPTLAPRMKQAHDPPSLGVGRANIAPFPCVTPKAGISQIVGIRCPAVLAADDMVDLMRRIGILFVEEAILAAISRTFGDQSSQRVAYVNGQAARVGAREPWP